MAAQQIQIQRGSKRATIIASSLQVWVAKGWTLVSENPAPADPESGDRAGKAEDDDATTPVVPEAEPAEPNAPPAGAHQAPPAKSLEARHG